MTTFSFFEVPSYETALPVRVAAWHVRSIRPIREQDADNEDITRIEFTNGDVLDSSDSLSCVLTRLGDAISPVTDLCSVVARR